MPSAPPAETASNFEETVNDPEKFVYIRKIEVLLNGTPIDQVICYHPQRIFCNGLE